MSTYDRLGLRFSYPENWTLDESDATEDNPSVTVYSPGGAFWSVIMHEAGMKPKQLVIAAREAMQEEYDHLDAEDFEETIAGEKVVGTTLNFYCLDLTNTAIFRSFRTPDATHLVFCQADDRELEEIGPIFDAMTHSLLKSAAVGAL